MICYSNSCIMSITTNHDKVCCDTNGKNHICAIRAMDQSISLGYETQRNAQCHIYRMPLSGVSVGSLQAWSKPCIVITNGFSVAMTPWYTDSPGGSPIGKISQFSLANPIFNRIIITPAIISIKLLLITLAFTLQIPAVN